MASRKPRSFLDNLHIPVPKGFRPFEFNHSWFSCENCPLLCQVRNDIAKSTTNGMFFHQTVEMFILELMNRIQLVLHQNSVSMREIQECLTNALQSVLFCFKFKQGFDMKPQCFGQLLKLRADINIKTGDTTTALQDLAAVKIATPTDPEVWVTTGQIYAESGRWEESFLEIARSLIAVDFSVWETSVHCFFPAVLSMLRSFPQLKDPVQTVKKIPIQHIFLPPHSSLWQDIVLQLISRRNYEGLGVITVGMCDNLIGWPTPSYPLFKAAAVSGVKGGSVNIGEILFDLKTKGIKKWHLKMSEFFIQRGADINTIAARFKKPPLLVMAMLSLGADTPTFIEVAWDRISPAEFDKMDSQFGSTFHFLVTHIATNGNRNLRTVEILVSSLLSKGCVPCLKDANSKLPHQLIPKGHRLHIMLEEAVSTPHQGLIKRLEKLTHLADEKKKDKDLSTAVDLYKMTVDICRYYHPTLERELAKSLLRLGIAYSKNGDFASCYDKVWEALLIEKRLKLFSGKTIYWVALSEEKQHKIFEAFTHYLEGVECQKDADDKCLMLGGCLKLLPQVIEAFLFHNVHCWNCIVEYVKRLETYWPLVIEVLNQKKLWNALKILCLGPPCSDKGSGSEGLLSALPYKGIDLHAVWDSLEDSSFNVVQLVLAVLRRGADFRTLSSNPEEGLHAVIRFEALMNDVSILKYVLENLESGQSVNGVDNDKRTPLHALCRIKNKKLTATTRAKLAELLYQNGCDPDLRDCGDSRAIDYATDSLKQWMATRQNPSPSSSTSSPSSPPRDWQSLKERGNKEYRKGNYDAAVKLYQQALAGLETETDSKVQNRDRAVILGNLAECFKKSDMFEYALTMAEESIKADLTWFKGHWRAGCIMYSMAQMERFGPSSRLIKKNAFGIFLKSLNLIPELDNEETRMQRLTVLSDVLSLGLGGNFSFPPNYRIQLDLCVSLIHHCISKEKDWAKALIAYKLLEGGRFARRHNFDLRLFCDKSKFEQYGFLVRRMIYFGLLTGSDINTLKCHLGDTIVHAAITIAVQADSSQSSQCLDSKEFFDFINKIVSNHVPTYVMSDDDKGNTPLHHLALLQGKSNTSEIRLHVARALVAEGCDVHRLNRRGKWASDLCPKSDPLRSYLLNVMDNIKRKTRQEAEKAGNSKPGMSQPSAGNRTTTTPATTPASSASPTQGAGAAKSTPCSAGNDKRREGKVETKTEKSQRPTSWDRSSSTSRKKGSPPAVADAKQPLPCDACEEIMRKALDEQLEGNSEEMYTHLVAVVNEKKHGKDERHITLKKTCEERIATALGLSDVPDIPRPLIKLCDEGLKNVSKLLIEKKKWTPMQILITQFKKLKPNTSTSFLQKFLSPQIVMSSKTFCDKEDERCALLEYLLKNGASLKPSSSSELVKNAIKFEEFKVVLLLLKHKADPKGVTLTKGDTPLHAALHIALRLDKGNFAVFDWLDSQDRKCFPYLSLTGQDSHGNTLLHIAAQVEFSFHSMKAVERLCKTRVPVNIKNKDGKLPRDYLSKLNDRRAEFLRTSKEAVLTQDLKKDNNGQKESSPSKKVKETRKERFSSQQCIEEMKRLPDVVVHLFPPSLDTTQPQNGDGDGEARGEEDNSDDSEDDRDLPSVTIDWSDGETTSSTAGQEEAADVKTLQDEDEEDIGMEPTSFDNLPWEVECTEDVWNLLKGCRKSKDDSESSENSGKKQRRRQRQEISVSSKRDIVKKIQQLAEGNWSLAKQVETGEQSLQLFRVNLGKASYIIFELAVVFSSKLDNKKPKGESGHFYCEIIRVWNIVLTATEACKTLQKIIMSHKRGKECFVKEKLHCTHTPKIESPASTHRYPLFYEEVKGVHTKNDDSVAVGSQRNLFICCPPASTGKMEFHILKFYAFSSTLVSAIFNHSDLKIDFPFKVTPLEHKIITLPSTSPILLLGRSGTGKTTICLYRLWEKFLEYWEAARYLEQPPELTDTPAFGAAQVAEQEETNHFGVDKERGEPDETPFEDLVQENPWMEKFDDDEDDDDDSSNGGNDGFHKNSDEMDDGEESDGDEPRSTRDDKDSGSNKLLQTTHLHQVFVTKNQQLCSEVERTFQRLRHSVDYVNAHTQSEDEPLPNTLQSLKDDSFPVFVTSRQLLLLLDASVVGKPFFQRDENMALKNIIPGWGGHEDIFHNIPLEDSSDEEGGDANDTTPDREAVGGSNGARGRKKVVQNFGATGAAPERKVEDRNECTYEVFAYQLWKKIAKKKVNDFHPSLIWTEIMSIIKGSYEALHSEKGYLTKEEYLRIGMKRAPNFSGDRNEAYSIFENYVKLKRERRLFDEADFVYNICARLREMPHFEWVFDEIYVDELQDFTQAELALLVTLAHEPNRMFLTGDTAQSIMHGISFRFEDLKSLFFFAKEAQPKKAKAIGSIKPPSEVYPLRYNYRSHSGILSLASSVLDLLTEYFKDSYDVLDKDQGLFEGPKPVLIETCSQSDLALLLSSNQRKTSHIEFGAHQAVLVTSSQARDNIPAALKTAIVLTIYESKGLEFDDVLIYNFFKDSQVSKYNDWRVVTKFLNEFVQAKVEAGLEDEIDTEPLQEHNKRPHPLHFNESHHKILNTELKLLYTALTRARVNVWIFDEDENKRAPVFEYFKVRKLVKTIGTGDQDDEFGEQLFTKKSSLQSWFAKGEMFMKRKQYEPAMKCFSMAQDDRMEQFASAHILAQRASQQKQPSMFLEAAKMFVHCKSLGLAAMCFVKAKHNQLAALAYEKNGQMKEAAAQYQQLSKYIDASRCFELAGRIDSAISVLVNCKNFERALDCLHRYQNILKDCQLESKELPQILRDHKPRDSLSETHLLYKLAEDYLAKDNEEMMFNTIERLEEREDQYHFLADKGYSREAAEILEDMGRTEEAAKLMLRVNDLDEGLKYAEKGEHHHLAASIHLIMARNSVAQREVLSTEDDSDKDLKGQIQANAQKALDLFTSIEDDNGKGQAYLILGSLKKSKDLLSKAHNSFQTVKPPNAAGQIEVFQEMFSLLLAKPFDIGVFKRIFAMIKKGIEVMGILKSPSKEETDRHLAYLTFYGLDITLPGLTTVSWNPFFRPIGLKRVKDISQHEDMGMIQMEKAEVIQAICESLGRDLASWSVVMRNSLTASMEDLYSDLSEAQVLTYVDLLCRQIELDWLVQTKKPCFDQASLGDLNCWESAQALLHFLPPTDLWLYQFDSKLMLKVLKKIRSSQNVKNQLSRYLIYKWNNPLRIKLRHSTKLTKERAKESDWLIRACLLDSLLGLGLDALKKSVDLETDILKLGKQWAMNSRRYAIYVVLDHSKANITAVESLGGRFIKMFQYLVGAKGQEPDPHEAVFRFVRLINAFANRDELSIMPRSDHLMFWLEFFSSLTLFYIGKSWQDDPNAYFYLPASYLQHFDIINACRQSKDAGSVLIDLVTYKPNKFFLRKRILDRQDFLINFLIGNSKSRSKFSMLKILPSICQEDPNYAERLIILVLVFLLNTSTQFVKPVHMNSIYRALMQVQYPPQIPESLHNLVEPLRTMTDHRQLSNHLTGFLASTYQVMLCCQWSDLTSPHLKKITLESTSSIETQPFSLPSSDHDDSNTNNSATEEDKETEEGEEFEEVDEFERSELERQATEKLEKQEEEKRKNDAAMIIVAFLRRYIERLKVNKRPYQEYEEKHLFAPYVLTQNRCGVCGVDFVPAEIKSDEVGQTREMHTSNPEHRSSLLQFDIFRHIYCAKIMKSLQDISIFLDEYQVREKPHIYRSIGIDVKKLTNSLSDFHNNLRELMLNRDWKRHIRATISFSLLEQTFETCSNMIRQHYEDFNRGNLDSHPSREEQENVFDDRF